MPDKAPAGVGDAHDVDQGGEAPPAVAGDAAAGEEDRRAVPVPAQAEAAEATAEGCRAAGALPSPPENGELKTLWLGDLPDWADEAFLFSLFIHTTRVVSAKVIRNKWTSLPEGYGFVEFDSHATADHILRRYNGARISDTHFLRLNWASFSNGQRRGDEPSSEYSIFVGDLAADVSDFLLQETFRERYASVRSAKCVTDPSSGRSKGYGFVRFTSEEEMKRAMVEMNGQILSNRPMRVNAATPKKTSPFSRASSSGGLPQQPHASPGFPLAVGGAGGLPVVPPHQHPRPYHGQFASSSTPSPAGSGNEVTNTTLFVGGLDPQITELDLRRSFGPFGDIIYVKIPPGRGCGFVQFRRRSDAEVALAAMNKQKLGSQSIRLSWGRASKQRGGGSAIAQAQYVPHAQAGGHPSPPHPHHGQQPPLPHLHSLPHPYLAHPSHHSGSPQHVAQPHQPLPSGPSLASGALTGTNGAVVTTSAPATVPQAGGSNYQIPGVYPVHYAMYTSHQFAPPPYGYPWQQHFYAGASSPGIAPTYFEAVGHMNPGDAPGEASPSDAIVTDHRTQHGLTEDPRHVDVSVGHEVVGTTAQDGVGQAGDVLGHPSEYGGRALDPAALIPQLAASSISEPEANQRVAEEPVDGAPPQAQLEPRGHISEYNGAAPEQRLTPGTHADDQKTWNEQQYAAAIGRAAVRSRGTSAESASPS